MTKRIIIVSVIVFILSVAIMDRVIVNNTIDILTTNSKEIERLIETKASQESVRAETDKLIANWNKRESGLLVFIYHQEVKEIGDRISLVNINVDAKDLDEADKENKQLLFTLETFKGLHRFSFFNIL
ncbi:MAG: DUF4363 family protein [Firmicutes bacterium]|nr:DUF4363 family protein [Bacillota bacterium]MCL2770838.1 DUF4363 family protein [Bacillota bacterium]